MGEGPRSLIDKLVSLCISLMVAAIALSVAATVIQPYLGLIAVVTLVGFAVAAWRAWQRSRW